MATSLNASDGAVTPSLAYYARGLNPTESLQLVLNLKRAEGLSFSAVSRYDPVLILRARRSQETR